MFNFKKWHVHESWDVWIFKMFVFEDLGMFNFSKMTCSGILGCLDIQIVFVFIRFCVFEDLGMFKFSEITLSGCLSIQLSPN